MVTVLTFHPCFPLLLIHLDQVDISERFLVRPVHDVAVEAVVEEDALEGLLDLAAGAGLCQGKFLLLLCRFGAAEQIQLHGLWVRHGTSWERRTSNRPSAKCSS